MKQVININYHGRIIPIEVPAYELLKNYIQSLHLYFNEETGKEEIINDIEDRIGELFQERLKNGAVCITDADVNAVITSMGRPEEFDLKDEFEQNQDKKEEKIKIKDTGKRLNRNEQNKIIGGVCAGLSDYFNIDVAVVRVLFVVMFFSFGIGLIPYLVLWIVAPNSTQGQIGAVRKKLYRDGEHKIIGGVCSGISEYFGIDVWIPRVVFLLPVIGTFISRFSDWDRIESFLPGAILAYLICWIVLPEAKTTSEKLEMKGEKIDVNSIKNTITEEMKEVGERIKKVGEEIKQNAQHKSKGFLGELGDVIAKIIRAVVKVLFFIIKAIAYTTMASMGLALLLTLFAITIGSFLAFPFKDFILNGFWQNAFAVGTVLFFIILAIVACIIWLIRKISGIKSQNKWITYSFLSLWILGWISIFGLFSLLGKDFSSLSHRDNNEKEIKIQQPIGGRLIIKMKKNPVLDQNDNSINFFEALDMFKDSIYINNVKVKIIRSLDDSFHIRTVMSAHGRSRYAADTTASAIRFTAYQQDSLIYVNQGIFLSKKEKFRNQQVVLLVSVPDGKNIVLDNSNSVSNYNNKNWVFEDWNDDVASPQEFQMTNEGLKLLAELKSTKSVAPIPTSSQSTQQQKEIDSLWKEKQKIEKEIEFKTKSNN
jgi:phage shock protein PspC (stress-responsive transcriptional regulator)